MSRTLARLALTGLLLMLAACQPGPTPTPIRNGATQQPGTTSAPVTTPAATVGSPITPGEANVITGRVTTERGEPIAEARMRIDGYIGGSTLEEVHETIETDADGMYRAEVPYGLYEVQGLAPVLFDRQVYAFDLEPVDGRCDQQYSDEGIVADFVLRLTGISPCNIGANPDDYIAYHGAAIQLLDQFTESQNPDAIVVYTLEPIEALADDSVAETLMVSRSVAEHENSAGPIDSSYILHDIPLTRYRASAELYQRDGSSVQLFVSTWTDPTRATSTEITFDARMGVSGTPNVGYTVPQLRIHDELYE